MSGRYAISFVSSHWWYKSQQAPFDQSRGNLVLLYATFVELNVEGEVMDVAVVLLYSISPCVHRFTAPRTSVRWRSIATNYARLLLPQSTPCTPLLTSMDTQECSNHISRRQHKYLGLRRMATKLVNLFYLTCAAALAVSWYHRRNSHRQKTQAFAHANHCQPVTNKLHGKWPLNIDLLKIQYDALQRNDLLISNSHTLRSMVPPLSWISWEREDLQQPTQ